MFLAFVVVTREVPAQIKGGWWKGTLALLLRYTAAVILVYLALKRKL
jgi:hypothetical protein